MGDSYQTAKFTIEGSVAIGVGGHLYERDGDVWVCRFCHGMVEKITEMIPVPCPDED